MLIDACKKLGWQFVLQHDELIVYNAKQNANLHGEYALKVKNNTVTFNRYYMKNGRELIAELQNQFYELNIEYAEQTVTQTFERAGFRMRKDWDFKANEQIAKQFFMVAQTKLANEEEKETILKFSILADGTIVTDSNYLPHDIHDLADQAMRTLDEAFGTMRREGIEIKRKTIPEKYKEKAYCSASGQIKSNQEITHNTKITLKF